MPPYKKNDFGYTVGGPVFIPGLYNKDRNKTFFFWSQEWRKERVPANLGSVTVPSLAERGGDFSDVFQPLGFGLSDRSPTQAAISRKHRTD